MSVVKHCFVILVFAFLAAPLLADPLVKPVVPPIPTTQPDAPIQQGVAEDQSIDLHGADGDLAQWLKAFDIKPGHFDYTIQLRLEDDFVLGYRVRFPSPVTSPWPENNVVPAEFYLPRHPKGKIRAAIVLDILAGNAVLARAMARGLAEGGVAALYMPMAYYSTRRPKSDPHFRVLERDPLRTIDVFRQSVMDIRRAKAILASRAEIDAGHVSITGISLGGIMTSLAAGVDGTFDRVVPILAGGDIADLMFHSPETRRLRTELDARGITPQQLAKDFAGIEPLHFASRIDPRRCLMINASADEVIPRVATDALAKAIGAPQVLWAPAGHISCIVFLPAIRQTTVRFISGQAVDKIEY
jgi:dienelactone hydrolase